MKNTIRSHLRKYLKAQKTRCGRASHRQATQSYY